MSSVIDSIERRQQRDGLPSFAPGDRVRVHFQVVEGIVLRRQGSGARETFTVRKQSFGVGVERTFPVHSPKIEKLEIAARGDVRRAKLYYLRGRVGKAARVAERRWGIDEEMISTPTTAEEPEAVDAEGETVAEAVGDTEQAEAAEAETPQDDAAEAAGPVAEDDSSSSQAASEEPSSTPPAAEAEEADADAPDAEQESDAESAPEAEASEGPDAEAEETEAVSSEKPSESDEDKA